MSIEVYTKLGTMPGEYLIWWGNRFPVQGERRRVKHKGHGEKWLPVTVDRVDGDGQFFMVFCSLL